MIQGVPEKNCLSTKVSFGELVFRRNCFWRNILEPMAATLPDVGQAACPRFSTVISLQTFIAKCKLTR